LDLKYVKDDEEAELKKRQQHLLHEVREGWRHSRFTEWRLSGRRDAIVTSDIAYSEYRCALTRKWVQKRQGKHAVTVFAGGCISDAKLEAIFGDKGGSQCKDCGCDPGSWHHHCWACPAAPPSIPVPTDMLQARLGWPPGIDEQYDTKVVEHLVATRHRLLARRYGGARRRQRRQAAAPNTRWSHGSNFDMEKHRDTEEEASEGDDPLHGDDVRGGCRTMHARQAGEGIDCAFGNPNDMTATNIQAAKTLKRAAPGRLSKTCFRYHCEDFSFCFSEFLPSGFCLHDDEVNDDLVGDYLPDDDDTVDPDEVHTLRLPTLA
jgi:hypothetical protein